MRILLSGILVSLSLAVLQAEEHRSAPVSDSKINHQVHSAIVADESLPYCAHVIKVQSEKGKVTLKGRVHTKEQKEKIEEKAADIAGDKNVINKVTVNGS
jgi:osmotically-inducible protein OsmY